MSVLLATSATLTIVWLEAPVKVVVTVAVKPTPDVFAVNLIVPAPNPLAWAFTVIPGVVLI